MAGGTKRSSWLAFRRRLLLVRTLLRGPASGPDLIKIVQRELGDHGYPTAAAAALKHDLDALKGEYGCVIIFQRVMGCYVLEDLGELALLDLPSECMEALAFLDASFPIGAAMPEQSNIRALLDRVLCLLPGERQREYQQQRRAIHLDLPAGATGAVDPTVLATVKRAIASRQELCFRYWSTFDVTVARMHRVAPYHIFFRPEGHIYLDATLLDVYPSGHETLYAAIDYRIDRMVPDTVQILPTMLPPERIQPQTYILRYRLLPVVARRRDVAAYFPETQITYHDDGSATITARITNLWQTRQILLRYGDACEVLEPARLIDLFRVTARGLWHLYDGGETR